MSPAHYFLVAAAVTAFIAAVVDLRTGHIPNGLTLGVLAVAPIAHGMVLLLAGHPARAAALSLGGSLAGAALCAVLPLAMYRSAGMGGGDVKLFAAIGALTGTMVGLHAQTYAFVFGMVWALVIVARSGRLASTFRNIAALVRTPLREDPEKRQAQREKMTSIRFGPAIFVGTVFAAIMCWRSA